MTLVQLKEMTSSSVLVGMNMDISLSMDGLRWLSRLSEVLPPLRSWVRALYRTADCAREEFVNTLPKVVGFLLVLRLPPTGNVDRVASD